MTKKIKNTILRLDTFTAFMGLVMVFAVLYSLYLNTSVSNQHESLSHARAELRSSIIMSHLWLEESLYGDKTVDIKKDVFDNLSMASSFYAHIDRSVKKNEELSKVFTLLGSKLDLLISQTGKRLELHKTGNYDPEFDKHYDEIFNYIILLIDKYSALTQEQMDVTHTKVTIVNALVILLLIISCISISILVTRYRQLIGQYSLSLEGSMATNIAIIDNAMDGIFTINSRGIIEYSNTACEQIFGYSAQELIGKNISILTPEPHRHQHDEYINNYLQTGIKKIIGTRRELMGVRKDGSEVAIELAVTEMRIGDEIRFTGIAHDISERITHQQELIVAKEKAESSDQVKSEFLSCMGHELRTPMNGVIGILSIMQEENLTDEQNSYIDMAYNSADTFLSLLNNILDFTKLEKDKIVLENIEFDIKKMTEDLTKSLSVKATEKGLNLSFLSSPKVPATVIGDPTRVRQVITNLVDNAIKFTRKGEVTINICEQERHDNLSTLRIDVIDTGIGVEEKDHERIFNMFTQADSSTTREFGGTGLGLSICKNLVTKMEGQIGVTTNPDNGSTFWFTLDMERGQGHSDIAPLNHDTRDINLLLACDHKKNLQFLQNLSVKWGINSTAIEGNNQANVIEKLKSTSESGSSFDLLVIDMLDYEKGLGLANTIKSNTELQNTKMIILTTGGKRGDAMKAQDEGILAYLTKPFKENHLLTCITTITNNEFVAENSLITKHSLAEAESNQRKKILITEDDLMGQKIVSGFLQGLGYRADIAENGKEAFDAIKEQHYDLVLMDCLMPIMDGYEATKHIRALEAGKKQHTIIVALTANAMKGDRDRCLAAGMDDYMTKPLKMDALEKILLHWLESDNEDNIRANA